MKTDDEKRAVTADLERYKQSLADDSVIQLSEDYEKGLVLVFFFAGKLQGVEESGFDIAASLRDMIASFDEIKETARLTDAANARKKACAARDERRKNPEPTAVVSDNPVTVRLLEIQKTIDAKNFVEATAQLTALSKTYPSEPRIYYNMGRVAGMFAAATDDPDIQARKLVEAKEAYTKVINTATADTDRSCSLSHMSPWQRYTSTSTATTRQDL